MEKTSKLQPGLIAAALLGLIALLFYGIFLSMNFATIEGGGESRMSNAFATLGAFAALWILLLILILIDMVRAGRPAWAGVAAIFLVPIAGAAVLFATDYPSNLPATLTVILLPIAIGAYLLTGMIPRLRATAGAPGANTILLLTIAALCVYPIVIFVS